MFHILQDNKCWTLSIYRRQRALSKGGNRSNKKL